MKSSSKKAKVIRKPLFRNTINVAENSSDGRSDETALPLFVEPDQKRSKINHLNHEHISGLPQQINVYSEHDDLISMVDTTSRSHRSEDNFKDKGSSLSEHQSSLKIRRKRSNKRVRCSVDDGISKTIPNDILDDESMWISTLEQNDFPDYEDRNVQVERSVSNHISYDDSIDTSAKTSTPFRTAPKKTDNSELVSCSETRQLSKENRVSEDAGSDSMIDYFGEDDSKLAALDVSELISSHNSASNDSISDKGDLVSGEILSHEKVQGVRPVNESSLQRPSNPHRDSYQSNKEAELFYGMPLKVGNLIKKYKGIEKLYDWQNDCLNLLGLQERRNLIYSLPTSGGKTLVAEILIMKELLCHEKDTILILPFVSIVQEKVRDLSLFAVDLEFLVEEYASNKGKFPPRKRRKKKSLYVATIEKANGLVNSLIEENRLSEIGLVVVDELHMLGEGGHRGAILEMCLAKILFCSSSTQLIGMSATLSNTEDLQRFLNAEKYTNDFRPVKLREFFKVEEEIFEVRTDKIGRNEEIPFKRFRRIKHQTNDKERIMNDPDHLSLLAQEVIPSYSCLIFCATKKNCQNVAELLAQALPRDLKKVKVKEKHELLRALKSNADGLCPILRRVIPYGIAYHHSGLTMDERKLIEEAYSQGTLCLLTCTSTLAAGVNLPAKRVILRSPYVGLNIMSRSQYKQMTGRAGRAGIDTSGESILILNKKDKDKVMGLVNAPLESCHSSLLHNDGLGLRSLVLSLIGLKVCNSLEEVKQFISKTLLAVQNGHEENSSLLGKVVENVDVLIKLKLVRKWETTVDGMIITNVETTGLGRATFKGCIDVDRSPFVYDELKRAQENLVLANDLHLLYLVTTPDMIANIQPSWMTYLRQVSSLSAVEQKASEFIGITEAFLSRKVAGHGSRKTEKDMIVVKRFYLTLMLYKIVQEHSLWDVANTFDIPRGFIQNLFSSSSSFAACLVHFTKELPEFHNMKLLLETIVDKLAYTAILELVPLMQIPGVKKARAKQLFNAGYRSLQAVAKSDPSTLVKDIEHLSGNQARLLVSSAKMMLLEKAEALQEEAADLIEM